MTWTFFTDRDLGKQFPAELVSAGISVEPHASHFKHNTPDEEWLAEVGRRGWVAVTHDQRIRYKPNELAAVSARCRAPRPDRATPMPMLAKNFIASIARIERFFDRHRAPLIAKVYRAPPSELQRFPLAVGRIEQWYP